VSSFNLSHIVAAKLRRPGHPLSLMTVVLISAAD